MPAGISQNVGNAQVSRSAWGTVGRRAAGRSPFAWCIVLTAVVAAGGCTSTDNSVATSEPVGPYAAEVKAAQAKAPSEFQKKILADGKITRAEYESATDAYVKCMNSHGVEISKAQTPGGIYQFAQVGNLSAPSPWVPKCADEANGYVSGLYENMLRNPKHLSENDLMAQCLVRKNVEPASYDGSDYAKDEAAAFKGSKVSPESQEYNACLDNPSGD